MVKSREMDMTKGPILKKLIICAVPLILTNLMQLLFNATDIAIVGMFVGDNAVAAVGSNGSLINLIVGLFVGLSTGANVVLAKSKGSNDLEKARRVVGTSVCVSVVTGSALIVVGVLGARTFLTWMSCPPEVIDMAVKYITIYFIGMPIIMLYNFLASILRAVGDNFRPMLYLFIGGVVNVGLNIFFVTVCNMDADGVAIATVVSQAISALLCFITVIKSKGYSKFSFKHFKIYKQEFLEILRIGLPSGIQGCLFAISNVILQSSINKLGELTVAANSVAGQFDGAVYFVGYSIALACMSFVSQNFGAGDMKRVKKVIGITILVVFVADIIVGSIIALFSEALVGIMTDSPEVIKIAQGRLNLLCYCYFLCGIMETLSFSMRALGKSTTSMILSLLGACVFRIVWVNTFYLLNPTYVMINLSLPISWILTVIALIAFIVPQIRKLERLISTNNKGQESSSLSELN